MAKAKLVLTPGGGAELFDANDNLIWASADDESFREEFPDEMLGEDDVEDVLEYLVEEDYLSQAEADRAEVEEESLNDDDDDDDDDEDD